ncbi:hypothetical protein XENOCAPTIV_016417, partial [Xenoophorus captivus]
VCSRIDKDGVIKRGAWREPPLVAGVVLGGAGLREKMHRGDKDLQTSARKMAMPNHGMLTQMPAALGPRERCL